MGLQSLPGELVYCLCPYIGASTLKDFRLANRWTANQTRDYICSITQNRICKIYPNLNIPKGILFHNYYKTRRVESDKDFSDLVGQFLLMTEGNIKEMQEGTPFKITTFVCRFLKNPELRLEIRLTYDQLSKLGVGKNLAADTFDVFFPKEIAKNILVSRHFTTYRKYSFCGDMPGPLMLYDNFKKLFDIISSNLERIDALLPK